jgi:hypothetical protein
MIAYVYVHASDVNVNCLSQSGWVSSVSTTMIHTKSNPPKTFSNVIYTQTLSITVSSNKCVHYDNNFNT